MGPQSDNAVMNRASTQAKAGLIRARNIVQRVDENGAPEILTNAAIHHVGGIIVSIGSFGELAKRHPELPVEGGDETVVAPGFVNSHHHVGLTPLQLGSPDLPLELWFASRLGARSLDPYLDTLYSAFEMISSGVTTVQHLHGRIFGPLETLLEGARSVIRAYRDIGMRASYSYGVRDQNRLVYEDDAVFCARLPGDIGDRLYELLKQQVVPVADALAVFFTLADENVAGGRTRVQLAPTNLHWCSDAALADIRDAAKTRQAPLHMHLLETVYQREYARRRTGGSAVRHLGKLGLLGAELTLGHGVWLAESEIELLAGTGTCVCCNASSNLRLRSGIAPHGAFRRARLTLGMGIDEAGLNEDRDMLLEMKLLLRMSRTPGMDEAPFTPAEILRIATEGGAATTPFKGTIGVLKPGFAADCVLFDWSKVAAPFLDERVPLVDALVQRAQARDISAVTIAGETVYRDGRFLNVDRDAVLKEIAETMAKPPSPDERDRARLSKEVLPHVRTFSSGYVDIDALQPHGVFNSRS
jgi:5-methylthioadenosine/S-adenosylhomocysteine deaminase